MTNEQIAITYSRKFVAQAAFLFWRIRRLSIRSIVFRSVISLFLVLSVACQKEKIPPGELIALFVFLILLWALLIFEYFIILIRFWRQLRPILGRTINYVLQDDRISISSDRGLKEVFWLDLDVYAKSSEVTLLYSSKKKLLFFFPNAMLSEKVQAFMSEKFNEAVTERLNERLKPPILGSASSFKEKYMTAIIVFSAVAVMLLLGSCNHQYIHPATNASIQTNNVVQH